MRAENWIPTFDKFDIGIHVGKLKVFLSSPFILNVGFNKIHICQLKAVIAVLFILKVSTVVMIFKLIYSTCVQNDF